MDTFSAKIVAVFFVFAIFWGAGFLGQKTFNTRRIQANHFYSKGNWVRILGLRPKHDRVYIRYASLQLLGFIYLIVGTFVAWKYDRPVFDKLTAYVMVVFFIFVIVVGYIDVFKKSESCYT
jgi:hypothetical protein